MRRAKSAGQSLSRAGDERTIEEYSVHWGKSATRKLASSSFIRDIKKEASSDSAAQHYISRDTKIPEGASHLLVFSKNDHGEHPSPASLKVVDHLKACLNATDVDCPLGVTVKGSDPEVFSVQRAKSESSLSHYVLYFGRRGCDSEEAHSGAKNGHITDLQINAAGDQPAEYELPADTRVPDGTSHVLVFSKNGYGESEVCVSASFVPKTGGEPKTEL